MITDTTVKQLPGPRSFFGLKNIRDLGQKGMLDFIAQQWREHGDLFEVQVGPQKLVIVINPEHVRHITINNAANYEKLKSYDGVRNYIVGDGIVTSTGELWKRQRRLMAPFYTPRGVQEFADIMLRDTLAMSERWERLAAERTQVEMFDEMALVTACLLYTSPSPRD